MKTIYKLSIIAFITIFMTGCGGDDDPATTESIADKIAGSWSIDPESNTLSTIMLDGLDVSSLFSDFTLTINSDLTYTTNSDALIIDTFPWPQSGSFAINDSGTQITRNDGLEITATYNSDYTLMTLMFTYSSEFDNAGGRTEGVSGLWEFIMVK